MHFNSNWIYIFFIKKKLQEEWFLVTNKILLQEGYECQCCSGFAGSHCEEIDACTPSPCTNNGICVDLSQGHEGNSYQCLCPYGKFISFFIVHLMTGMFYWVIVSWFHIVRKIAFSQHDMRQMKKYSVINSSFACFYDNLILTLNPFHSNVNILLIKNITNTQTQLFHIFSYLLSLHLR